MEFNSAFKALKKVVHMQSMPAIVSPELRNAEPRWLAKATPRGFPF
jgi:hypothetical protein